MPLWDSGVSLAFDEGDQGSVAILPRIDAPNPPDDALKTPPTVWVKRSAPLEQPLMCHPPPKRIVILIHVASRYLGVTLAFDEAKQMCEPVFPLI